MKKIITTIFTAIILIAGYNTLNAQECPGYDPPTLSGSTSTPPGTFLASRQWQSRPSTGSYTNISGATSSTYNPGSLSSTRTFRRLDQYCPLSGSCTAYPPSYTNPQTIFIKQVPTVTISGAEGTSCSSDGFINFTSSYTGGVSGETYSYQWYSAAEGSANYSNIPGANSSTYSPSNPPIGTRDYRLRVIDSQGCYNLQLSNPKTQTVYESPSIRLSIGGTVTQVVERTVCTDVGFPGFLAAIKDVGGSNLTYKWFQSSSENSGYSEISNPGGNSAIFPFSFPVGVHYFKVSAIDPDQDNCDSPLSNSVKLTVVEPPTANIVTSAANCAGGNITLFSEHSGGTSDCTSYQWYKSTTGIDGNYVLIPGATSINYTFPATDDAYYKVQKPCSDIFDCAYPMSGPKRGVLVNNGITSLTGGGTINSGESRTLTLTGSGGTIGIGINIIQYIWSKSTVGPNGPYEDFSSPDGTTYNTGPLTETTWFKALYSAGGSACNYAESDPVLVQVCIPTSVLYVDAFATSVGDGSNWANAYNDLQDALDQGMNCGADSIMLAEGTYYPGSFPGGPTGNGRDRAFHYNSNVVIEGGYNPSTGVQDGSATILSGDIGVQGDASDNTYHVMITTGLDQTSVFNNVTFRDGNANGSNSSLTYEGVSFNRQYGGGIYNKSSSPTYANCVFTSNHAELYGGGIYITSNSNPILTSCHFIGNTAVFGAGLSNAFSSETSITDCTFSQNVADDGNSITNRSSANLIFSGSNQIEE